MGDFRTLLAYVKKYWPSSVLYLVFNALSVIFALFSFTMVIPFLRVLFNPEKLVKTLEPWAFNSRVLIHNLNYYLSQVIVNQGAVKALMFISIMVIVASLLKNGFFYLGRYVMASVRNGVVRDLMRDLYHKIVSLPIGFFNEERKGNILTRITNDTTEVREAVEAVHNLLFRDPVSILFFTFYLFYLSVGMTIFVLIFLPIVGYVIVTIAQNLKRRSYEVQQSLGTIVAQTEETITGLRIIKGFNAESKIIKKFEDLIFSLYKLMKKVERRVFLSHPLSEFLGTIVVIVIMFFGGSMILSGKTALTSEAFIAYLVVFSQLITPVKALTKSYYILQKGMASMKRIKEVLSVENPIKEKPDARSIKEFKAAIELRNVHFSYGDKEVLTNINMSIPHGSMVAIVGESGAGKSTLVDLIPRFYDVTKGAIFIDGNDIRNLKIKDLRGLFGIVNQQPILFNDTIENNITIGVDSYTEEDLIRAARIANAYDFIMEKPGGFKEIVGEGGNKLSGGQKQRISIARAVLKNPPILILDEATSSLDTESEKLVQDALNKLMKNRTSIVIAHRLSTVRNADMIYVIQKGQIIEQGTHEQLIALGGYYKKLVDMQSLA